jgi:hypothetical protein
MCHGRVLCREAAVRCMRSRVTEVERWSVCVCVLCVMSVDVRHIINTSGTTQQALGCDVRVCVCVCVCVCVFCV